MEFILPDVVWTWQFWLTALMCYVICEAVKQIPHMTSWGINLINLVVGAFVYTALIGGWDVAASYMFGIFASAMADFAYQIFSNTYGVFIKKDEEIIKPGGTE